MNTLLIKKSKWFLFLSMVILVISLTTCNTLEEVRYGTGSWDADSLGNHRAVIHVSKKAGAIWAHIPWRRRDFHPEEKNIIVIDAKTRNRVNNVFRAGVNREYGDLIFQPQTVPGKYYIYYMPYITSGSRNYPKVYYQEPEYTVREEWLQSQDLTPANLPKDYLYKLPKAKLIEIQAIDEFNSFYPMEIIATSSEVKALLNKHRGLSYFLFPEDRSNPIRMTDDLPYKLDQGGFPDKF